MMKQSIAGYSVSFFCMLVFCFVLAACGGSTASGTNTAPAATATLVPTATLAPTATPTPSVSLTTTTGDGYTIGYPSGWISKKSTINTGSILQVASDASGLTSLIAETVANTSVVSTGGSVRGALAGVQGQSKNFQAKSLPATVTINGIAWDQGAATMDDPTTGKNSTIYVLSTKFPGKANKLVTIVYTAATSDFDKFNTEDFQPILLSFKFM